MGSSIIANRFHYFDVGGSPYRISWGQLVAFPSSLLTKLAEAAPSLIEPVKIDRDSGLFDIVIELMRHKDPIYAAHLRKKDEFDRLLKDLEFYRLADLKNFVSTQLADEYLDNSVVDSIQMVHLDHVRHIEDISRPLVVVGLDTILWLDEFLPRAKEPDYPHHLKYNPDGPNLLEPNELALLFDHRHYDVKLFHSQSPGLPFRQKGILHQEEFADNRPRRYGVNHLCLYMPNSGGKPLLVLDKNYSTANEFRSQLNEFLIAVDLAIRMPEHYKLKLNGLLYTCIPEEPEQGEQPEQHQEPDESGEEY